MLRNSTTVIPYNDIDFEIRDLCIELNKFDGIETIESCCGHGKYPCMIWFVVESIDDLNNLIFNYFNHEPKWQIIADTSDPILNYDKLKFVLTTDDVTDEYFVSLMVYNLKNRIKYNKIIKG